MFKEITEQEIADMFNISLEQFKKEYADGTIRCFANDEKIFIGFSFTRWFDGGMFTGNR